MIRTCLTVQSKHHTLRVLLYCDLKHFNAVAVRVVLLQRSISTCELSQVGVSAACDIIYSSLTVKLATCCGVNHVCPSNPHILHAHTHTNAHSAYNLGNTHRTFRAEKRACWKDRGIKEEKNIYLRVSVIEQILCK